MNVVLEEVSSCRKRLKIEVPANRVNDAVDRVTVAFQKEARIQGFRPGKAPRALIEKRFSSDIEEEVKRTLIPEAYQEAVKTKQLKVVSAPQIEDLHFQRGVSLSFSTVVDLEPEFVLPSYKGIRVKKVDAEPTEEDIQGVITRILDQDAAYNDVTRPAAEGEFAVIDFKGTIDGKPVTETAPDATFFNERQGFWLLLKDDTFLPGFAPQVIGASAGDTRTVTATFPADFPQEALRGKTASFEVKVNAVKEKVLPVYDDALTQKIAQKNKDEFEVELRENVRRSKEERARSEQIKEIIDVLKNAVKFDLPESSVTNETQRLIYDIVRENQMRGITDEVLEEKKSDIFAAAQTSARDKVKVAFILKKIADAEKIDASTEEMIAEAQVMAQRYNMPVQKLLEKLREGQGLAALHDDLVNRKTIDFVLQSATIE
jgi:trigger factor